MIKNLSAFFPVFNEEKNLQEIVIRAIKVLDALKIQYEIIIIDDGSSDKTGPIADRISKDNPKIRVIHHPRNLGYGEALKTGFYNSRYDVIVYNDGDGQFDFSEVTNFFPVIEESDLIMGYRINRKDSMMRVLFAKGWAFSLYLFFGLKLKDVDCGFKMVKRTVLEKITRLESTRGGMINAELPIKAKISGFKVAQVGVNHYPRSFGKPTGANINVILTSFRDLFRLWRKLR